MLSCANQFLDLMRILLDGKYVQYVLHNAQGKGGLMRKGSDMAGRFAEGGGIHRVEAVATSNSVLALKPGVMMEPKLRNE